MCGGKGTPIPNEASNWRMGEMFAGMFGKNGNLFVPLEIKPQ